MNSSGGLNQQSGFSLPEVLVSLLMFAVVGMSIVSFTSDALRKLSLESRASIGSNEVRNAIALLSSEMRMSSSISPYLTGNNPATVDCTSLRSTTSTTLKFLVTEDDPYNITTNGLSPFYVGYKYDASTKQLLRGEIPASSVTACALPAGDPTSSTYAKVLAENIERVDYDGNGTLDPVFSLSGNVLTVTVGLKISSGSRMTVTQNFSTEIYLRTN